MEAKAFEPLELQYDNLSEVSEYVRNELSQEQKDIIKQLTKLIDGFQSALSIEILASVDYIKKENPGISKEDAVLKVKWSERKKQLFQDRYLDVAWKHLENYSLELNFA